MDFKNRVVLVTGAGRGLGKAYAEAYAELGAKVVVNDLDRDVVDQTVAEIKKRGGEAVADYNSVTDGEKVVQTAIRAFGRIDVVVNNAGVLRDRTFHKMSDEDWKLLHNVHLNGAYSVTRAAWPHFLKQKYGRVVMVTSASGLYGNFGQTHYSTVKLGQVGFGLTLAQEGRKRGILTNMVAPVAGSRMTATILPPDLVQALKPEYVAPLVLWLTSEQNTDINGEIFEVGAGWVSKVRWQRSAGVFFPVKDGREFTIEDVQRNWDKICDLDNPDTVEYPTSGQESMGPIFANLQGEAPEELRAVMSTASPAAAGRGGGGGGAGKRRAGGGSGGKNKHVDLDQALGYEMPPNKFEYTERDVILYALGVGACSDPHTEREDLKFVYENHDEFSVLPTMGVVIPFAALGNVMNTPGLEFNPMMLLHGEQSLEIVRPIPTRGVLTNHGRIGAIYDKGKGAVVAVDVETKDDSGQVILKNRYSCFIRGIGGFGGDPGPKSPDYSPPVNIPPQVIHSEQTRPNQAVLYRLSGDYNPLHIDYSMAKMGGFDRPILHGLCSFGYACRAILKHFCENDPNRFRAVSVRFAAPVFPGETLVTEMWKVGEDRIVFQVKVAERGVYVLRNCQVTLNPPEQGQGQEEADGSSTGAGAGAASVPMPAAEKVFGMMAQQANRDLVKKVNAKFRFDISKGSATRSWLADFKSGDGSVTEVPAKKGKADCIISISDEDFVGLMTGKLDPQKAFMTGKIKIKGNMMLAQKLALLNPKSSRL